jgi:hypothetical protein
MAYTYTTLKQAIQDTAESTETTFVNNLDRLIQAAEDRVLMEAELELFKKNATATTGVGTKYLAMPTDYLAPYSMEMTYNGVTDDVILKDLEFVKDYAKGASAGRPKYFAPYDISTFFLAPSTDVAYTAELHYFYRPTSIVTAGTTWLGTNASNALFYACMVEAGVFLRNEADTMQTYQTMYLQYLARLKNLAEGKENSDAYRLGTLRTRAT